MPVFPMLLGRYWNAFIAIDHPFYITPHLPAWMFDTSFAATCATIVSGAMAERTKLGAYIAYTVLLSGFVYPCVYHWVQSPEGWMSKSNLRAPMPVLDFAGCGYVHMVGGFSGLIGAYMVGPRIGWVSNKYDIGSNFGNTQTDERSRATQVLWIVQGTFCLWIGWYGFNCGSTGLSLPLEHAIDFFE